MKLFTTLCLCFLCLGIVYGSCINAENNKGQPINPIKDVERLLQEKKIEQALSTLENTLQTIKGQQPQPEWAEEAFSLAGSLYAEKQQYPEAMLAFQQAWQSTSEAKKWQSTYACVLIRLQRYDLALDVLSRIKEKGWLAPDDKAAFIESLVHTGAFAKASGQALAWLIEDPPLPLETQLKIARQLYIAKDKDLVNRIIARLPEKRPVDADIQLLALLQETGNYPTAAKIVEAIHVQLEKTSAGLMILSLYEWRLSREKEALNLAKKALEKDPLNQEALNFILEQHKDPQLLQTNMESNKNLFEADPRQISSRIQYVRDLIEQTIQAALTGTNETVIMHSPYLSKAYGQLNLLTKKYAELPEPFFLLGQTLYLTDQIEESTQAYLKAIALDKSFSDAYKYLALIYQDQDQPDKAFQALQNALQYTPWDAESWILVSRLFQQQSNPLDAADALQHALKYKPYDINLLLKLSRLQLDVNDLESAEITLGHVLHLAPANAEALKLILQLLYDPVYILEFPDEAMLKERQHKYYEKLYQIDPAEAQKIKPKIDT